MPPTTTRNFKSKLLHHHIPTSPGISNTKFHAQFKPQFPSTTTFNVHYSPFHKVDLIAAGHPPSAHAITIRKPPRVSNGLLWSVTAPVKLATKATVRNSARRRIAESFREALRARGYDQKGFVRAEKNPDEAVGKEAAGGESMRKLTGTINMSLRPTALTAERGLIDAETREVVEVLLNLRSR